MNIGKWWAELEKALVALAAEDAAFRDDHQYKTIAKAVALGVQMTGGMQDQSLGEQIDETLNTIGSAPLFLPEVDRSDERAYQRSRMLIQTYIDHLHRYAHVHAAFSRPIKFAAKHIAQKDLDAIANKIKNKCIPFLEAQLAEPRQAPVKKALQPTEIRAEVAKLNDDYQKKEALFIAMVAQVNDLIQQLSTISASLTFRILSWFSLKPTKYIKLESELEQAHVRKQSSENELREIVVVGGDLRKQYVEFCSVESIIRRVKDWDSLDEASREVTTGKLYKVLQQANISSYENPIEIAAQLAKKIEKAMYNKVVGGKGIYIENYGCTARTWAKVFNSADVILTTAGLVGEIANVGKRVEVQPGLRVRQ